MPENPEVTARASLVRQLHEVARSLAGGFGLGEEMPPCSLNVLVSQAANEVEDLGKLKHEEEWAFRDRVERHLRRSLADFFRVETDYEPEMFQATTDPDDPTRFDLRARTSRLTVNLRVDYERSHLARRPAP
jgi:hypothetical protein